jgi:hypothetical protein
MPLIHIAKSFILSLDSGKKVHLPAGQHRVSDEVAEHWYTRLHLVGVYQEPSPVPWRQQSAERLAAEHGWEQERRRRVAEELMDRLPHRRFATWDRFADQLNSKIAMEEVIAAQQRRLREYEQARIAAQQRRIAELHAANERLRQERLAAEERLRVERERKAFERNVASWRQQLPAIMTNPNLAAALEREIAEFEHDWLDPGEAAEVANVAAGATWHHKPSSTIH